MKRLRWMLLLAFCLIAAVALNPASRPFVHNQISILGGNWKNDLVDPSGNVLAPDTTTMLVNTGAHDDDLLCCYLRGAYDNAEDFYAFAEAHDSPEIWGMFVRSLAGVVIAKDSARNQKIRPLFFKAVQHGRELDPHNLFFSLVEASTSIIQGRDAQTKVALESCRQSASYDDFLMAEYELYVRQLERRGLTTSVPKLTVAASVMLPQYALFNRAAKEIALGPFPGKRLEFAEASEKLSRQTNTFIGLFVSRAMLRSCVSSTWTSVVAGNKDEQFQDLANQFDKKEAALGVHSHVADSLSKSNRLVNAARDRIGSDLDWGYGHIPLDLPTAAIASILAIPGLTLLGLMWLRVPRRIAIGMFPYLLASLASFVVLISDRSNYVDFTAFNLSFLLVIASTFHLGTRAARIVSAVGLLVFGFMIYVGQRNYGFEVGVLGLAVSLGAGYASWRVPFETRTAWSKYAAVGAGLVLGVSAIGEAVYVAPLLVFALALGLSRTSKFVPCMDGFAPALFLLLTGVGGSVYVYSACSSGHDLVLDSLFKAVGLVLLGSFPLMFLNLRSLLASVAVALGLFSTTYVIATGFAVHQEASDAAMLNSFLHGIESVRSSAGVTYRF